MTNYDFAQIFKNLEVIAPSAPRLVRLCSPTNENLTYWRKFILENLVKTKKRFLFELYKNKVYIKGKKFSVKGKKILVQIKDQ